jgi:hypothetical protein
MQTHLDCIPCFIRQALDAAKLTTDDQQIHEQVIREVLALAKDLDMSQSPPAMGQKIHRLIREFVGIEDPYRDVKRQFNNAAIRLYPKMRIHINESKDKLETAIRLTIAGNMARWQAEVILGLLETMPFLVTDYGPTFIAKRFYKHIQDLYSHVRIRYRTPTQLGLLERFHRTLKEEEIYWRLYDNPSHGRACLEKFRYRYNTIRPHWALLPLQGGDPMTTYEVYIDGQVIAIPKWQGWAKMAKEKLDQLMREEAA